MGFELELLNNIQTIRTPLLDDLMVLISTIGNKGMIWILLTAALIWIPSRRETGKEMAAALIIDLILCNIILKPLVARMRPFEVYPAIQLLVEAPKDFSFPSGHTAAAFAAVTVLWLKKDRSLCIPVLILACLMAFSRMYLYVHFPTDVLGGIITGIICGYLGCKLVQILKERK